MRSTISMVRGISTPCGRLYNEESICRPSRGRTFNKTRSVTVLRSPKRRDTSRGQPRSFLRWCYRCLAPWRLRNGSNTSTRCDGGVRLRKPTRWFETAINLAPTFINDFPQPGALPIVLNGQVIGAIGVSSGDGENCAQAAIDAVFKGQVTTSSR